MNTENNAYIEDAGRNDDSFLDNIKPQEIIGAILSAWPVLLVFLLIGYGIGRYNTYTTPSTYKADALLQVETTSNQARIALSQTASAIEQSTALPAEIEILRSRKILGEVARRAGLDIEIMPSFLPYIGEAIWRNHRGQDFGAPPSWVGPFVRSRHAWGGEKLVVSAFEVPKKLENVRFSISHSGSGKYDFLQGDTVKLGVGQVGERLVVNHPAGNIELFVQELRSPPGRLFYIIKRPLQVASALINGRLRANPRAGGANASILELTYTSTDRDDTVTVLRNILDVFQQQNVERRSAEARKTLEFLEMQLPDLRRQLETAEARLNNFKVEQGTADLTQETTLVLSRSVEIESELNELIRLRDQALRKYTENHPVVLARNQEIARVQGLLENLESRVRLLPKAQQQALKLTRDVQVLTTLYVSLLNRAQELEIVKSGTIGNVRVIDAPVRPLGASGPNRLALLVTPIMVMLALAICLVLLRFFARHGVSDPKQIETRLGLPTYGTIPFSKKQSKLTEKRSASAASSSLLSIADPQCVTMEAIRSARTGLYFSHMDAKNNAIMITGPEPGVGKSFFSANLSASLANAGKRTLLIDADMRRGSLHELFGVDRDVGLSEILSGLANSAVATKETAVPGLHLITSGAIPPNPAELLIKERFAELLALFQEKYDFIVLDTPPALAVTDASIIGRLTGTNFVVLKSGAHSMRMIDDTIDRLSTRGVNVTGTIFNQMGRQGASSYGYYGYNYYQQEYKAAT